MYVQYQPNPRNLRTDDCVIRALTKALNVDWDTASIYAIVQQIRDSDIYVKNYVWGNLLLRNGFTKHHLPDTCPDCYIMHAGVTLWAGTRPDAEECLMMTAWWKSCAI